MGLGLAAATRRSARQLLGVLGARSGQDPNGVFRASFRVGNDEW